VSLSKERMLWLYEKMVLIRRFEDTFAQESLSGRVRSYGHLYAGQEAVAVGVGAHLRSEDYIAITYRGHGHSIVKGTDINRMMAELFGKATGTNKGKGGSMHIADINLGVVTANVMVGMTIPYAVGFALSQSGAPDEPSPPPFRRRRRRQGVFQEGLNLAVMWKLPVLFVCENNRYAQSTPIEYGSPVPIVGRVAASGVPARSVDGMDVFADHQAAGEAVEAIRSGSGPVFLECHTYRYSGHYVGDNTLAYRTKEEEDQYRQRDPLLLFRQRVLGEEMLSPAELDAVEADVKQRMQEAVLFASESPVPAPEELMTDVYERYP
jgi:pyruvate dehydrogenase E1 component alpha subunit